MNATKAKALKTLNLWVIPAIMGRPVAELVAGISDEFAVAHRRDLCSRNVANVIAAVATGNGMNVSD